MNLIQKLLWKHGNLRTQYKIFAKYGEEYYGYNIISSTTFGACVKLIENKKEDYYLWGSFNNMWLGYHGNHIVIVREHIPIGQMEHFAEWMQKVNKDFPSITFVFFTTQKEPMYGWMDPNIVFYTINPKEYKSPYWAMSAMINLDCSIRNKKDK